ncbi:hypothetical protein SPRG_12478 [Saprolegnia parasitica CBS 223.65]|uniref:CCT domain-containing protein n=1 Tax=Saprolegnia parasitica (strain CBS 223.65) TaxID=695850 RepID=A0A067BSK6_SAPPC|nr:hypothetical protein SPRG_12478 [Saprolegnia parasitica CBS 223.65]KDO21514.1 hypothetical protein SPRG_12478 [Saprolegnia parasitica CBS 223.65]|eukprot:XP_012207781.1 hypothetical protein SPRG_12478 [Saprolegnia parasitica CBS 223.65]
MSQVRRGEGGRESTDLGVACAADAAPTYAVVPAPAHEPSGAAIVSHAILVSPAASDDASAHSAQPTSSRVSPQLARDRSASPVAPGTAPSPATDAIVPQRTAADSGAPPAAISATPATTTPAAATATATAATATAAAKAPCVPAPPPNVLVGRVERTVARGAVSEQGPRRARFLGAERALAPRKPEAHRVGRSPHAPRRRAQRGGRDAACDPVQVPQDGVAAARFAGAAGDGTEQCAAQERSWLRSHDPAVPPPRVPEYRSDFNPNAPRYATPQELPRPSYAPPPQAEEPPAPPARPAKTSSGRYFPKGYGQPYEAPTPAAPATSHASTYAQHAASNRHSGHHVMPLPPPPTRGPNPNANSATSAPTSVTNYRGGAPFEFPKPSAMGFGSQRSPAGRATGPSPRNNATLAPLGKRPLLLQEKGSNSNTPTSSTLKGPMPMATPPRVYRTNKERSLSNEDGDDNATQRPVAMDKTTTAKGHDDDDDDDDVPTHKKQKRLSAVGGGGRAPSGQVPSRARSRDGRGRRAQVNSPVGPPAVVAACIQQVVGWDRQDWGYTPRSRRLLLERYHLKRTKRLTRHKWFKYPVRKTLADSRPRVKGRFVKNDEHDGSPSARFDDDKPPIAVPTDFDYIQAFAACVKDTQTSVEDVVADIVAAKQLISWDTWTMELEHALIALLPKDYASSPFPAIFAELVYILGDAEEECNQANYCKALQAGAIYVAICLSLFTSLDPPSSYAHDADLSPIVRYYLASIEEMYRTAPRVERRHTFALMKAIVDGIAGVICTGFETGKRYLRPVSIPAILAAAPPSSSSRSPDDDESAL